MAGGVGSRFWPMSTSELPKQFHDVIGTGKTLIRMTFERILPICDVGNILIVTNSKYRSLVRENLPEISDDQILCEPHMRNTAPCLAFANFWISKKTDDANIVVLSADQLITNETQFFNDISTAIEVSIESQGLITIGIKPSHPNTGYGYIQFEDQRYLHFDKARKVKTFTEKPSFELAEKFIESGEFFWNSGIFIWSLSSIQKAFKNLLPDMFDLFNEHRAAFCTSEQDAVVDNIYPKCQNISIDYGVLEKADNVYVMLSDFGWSDLGTWGSVYNHLPKDEFKNAQSDSKAIFVESEQNVVKLDTVKKAVIQGLSNYIVVESNGVLLICEKSQEQRIKQFSKLV